MSAMEPADLFSQEARLSPYRIYDGLRGTGPLQVGPTRWALLDHADVRAALADPASFSSNLRVLDNPVFRASPLIFDDPPRHGQLRRLVTTALTPSRIGRLVPWLRDLAVGLIDAMGAGPVDVVAGFANPMPVYAIARLLGVPGEQHERFKRWSHDRTFVAYHGGSRAKRTPELEAAEAGCAALDAFLEDLVECRRSRPEEDLLSALVAASVDGLALTTSEVVGIAAVLLSAGNVTTTRLLSSLLFSLSADGALWERLRRRRELVEPFVEEVLRLESPVQFPARLTTCPVELSGRTIPEGHFVMIGLGAANRDGAAFAAADSFVAGRAEPHVAFGYGIHYCAGAALARQEAAVTLNALFDRYRGVVQAAPPLAEEGLAHRGYAELVLRFDSSAVRARVPPAVRRSHEHRGTAPPE
jgi:cytochrome P450 family 109